MASWQGLSGREHMKLPPRVRDWVGLQTSMTARVGLVADSEISVDVLQQARGKLHEDERKFFTDPPAEQGVVREVCLKAEEQPFLVARTVFTSRRLEEHPTIVRLGNHALGSLLFADGPPRFTAREFIYFDQSSPLWGLVGQCYDKVQSHYWARRTLFWLFDESLLVTEIFLPELLNHPRAAELRA